MKASLARMFAFVPDESRIAQYPSPDDLVEVILYSPAGMSVPTFRVPGPYVAVT